MASLTANSLRLAISIIVPSISPQWLFGAEQCIKFALVTKDSLGNTQQGLLKADLKWYEEKLSKGNLGICYIRPGETPSLIFYVTVTPAVYNGTRVVTSQSSSPDGDAVASSSVAVPYSVDYGIYTLSLERVTPDNKVQVVHRFQQKGLYWRTYGIPHGKGHHPVRTLIEQVNDWIAKGGLSDPLQSVVE